MKPHLFMLLFLGVSSLYAAPDKPTFDPDAIPPTEIAKQWVESLLKGDIERTLNLSATPFDWDGKKTCKSKEELKAAYQEVVDGKGAREMKVTTAKQLKSKEGIIEVEVRVGKDEVRVKLKNLKVIGVRD